jgi:hypothetical protein
MIASQKALFPGMGITLKSFTEPASSRQIVNLTVERDLVAECTKYFISSSAI